VLFVSDSSMPGLQMLKQVLEAIVHRPGSGCIRCIVNKYVTSHGPERARLCEILGTEQVWMIANDPSAYSAAFVSGSCLREAAPNSPALADIDHLARALFGTPIVPNPPRTGLRRLLRS
jgi:Flp pilus assembly CpaE family ATPase